MISFKCRYAIVMGIFYVFCLYQQDKDFGKQMLHRTHANPPADLASSLKTYQKYTFQKAYAGQDIFWGTAPKLGDLVNIKLKTPVELES